MKRRLILLMTLLIAAVPVAHAENAANGQKLARALCVNCHIVEPGGSAGNIAADVPSFTAIAKIPGWNAGKVEGFILNPHPPMPQVQLTASELTDIAAYIVSLK
jgi:mono/diheme cytochrome c family protein